jgi:hypothetical protein
VVARAFNLLVARIRADRARSKIRLCAPNARASDSEVAAILYDFPSISAKAVVRVGHVRHSSFDRPGVEQGSP